MQVKKFEAPTIQEALDNVKRELGPEAIILQTKRNKRGFGLLSKSSVEVTAAISDRSLQKKQTVEERLTESSKNLIKNLPSERQVELINKYADQNITKSKKSIESIENSEKYKKITATRYIDIVDHINVKPTHLTHTTNPVNLTHTTQQSIDSTSKILPNVISLEEEVKTLKQVIEELRHSSELAAENSSFQYYSGASSPELQDAFEHLTLHGISRNYAYDLVKKVAFELVGHEKKHFKSENIMDLLASEIMQSIEIQEMFLETSTNYSKNDLSTSQRPMVIALAGPSGMGKTTTLAKLANEALIKKKLKVGLVNLDYQKTSAFDQLATYSKILNIPFRSASTLEDFRAAMRDFQGVDIIFVDTGGFSQKDSNAIKNTAEILQTAICLRVYLLLSANTREIELYDAVNRFSVLRPNGMIMSKLDETMLYGSIYNVSRRVKLPLVYFTTGQKVPEDIEISTKERVVSLVMDI